MGHIVVVVCGGVVGSVPMAKMADCSIALLPGASQGQSFIAQTSCVDILNEISLYLNGNRCSSLDPLQEPSTLSAQCMRHLILVLK